MSDFKRPHLATICDNQQKTTRPCSFDQQGENIDESYKFLMDFFGNVNLGIKGHIFRVYFELFRYETHARDHDIFIKSTVE